MNRKRVAVLISGRGSNMAALIEAARDKTYPAEIVAVISNRPDAGGLTVARANGIVTKIVDHTAFGKDRAAFEHALQAVLEKYRIDILCLAGFMRLLTAGFVKQWQHRILNIHPALLPAFKGLDTHRRALEAAVKVHGATVHFVVPEMDSGPIIAQAAVNVRPGETEDELAARVLEVEHQIYPLALRLLAEGRLQIENGRCQIDGVPVPDTTSLIPVP
jgi:phosphoribosylglycinamide formyltransferase-1